MKPTNLTLLDMRGIVPGVFKQVTSTDAFEGMTQNLNDDGLYSIEIFGKLGSKERDETEAYIDTKLDIFNPTYFKALIQLKSLYAGILKGSEYAVWDNEAKDFIKSNIIEGQTGFSFFMKHVNSIKHKLTDSYKRKQRVELVSRFKEIATAPKVLVPPAGLRDIQFQPNGAVVEPELTEFYRKLMFRARVVSVGTADDKENPLYDNVRWGLQQAYLDIDAYLFGLMDGKGGLFQRRVSTRGVVSGTRNVITARKVSRPFLSQDNGVSPNSTDVGLYQAMLNFQYVCINALLSKYLEPIFSQGSTTAKLVDMKTLEFDYVEVSPAVVEKWTTATGLTKMFNGFSNTHLRNKPIKIGGHYLALVYDDGTDVCVLNDINDLPAGKDRKFVTPITYMELFYLSCQATIMDQMAQQTRYPIIGIGSIVPAQINLLTITGATKRNIVDTNWDVIETCQRYPHKTDKPDYFDAMSVDPTREAGYDSDHDGDQLNCNSVCAEDSKAEVRDLFGKREYYISGSGRFLYDPVNEPILFMLKAATSGMEE